MDAKLQTNKVYEILQDSEKRITVMQGGSRSGKTYNILIWFIVKLLQENGKTLTVVRQSLPSIKGTVLRDFIDILMRLNIYSEDNHNKTDQIYSLNGNIIEFVSADQPQKIRGRARNYLFCNEANELSYEAWMQLVMRTEGKIVIDYNPSDVSSWIYDTVIPRDDADFHITTFMDNPFLPKELVDELTRLKDADPNYWQIYGLGERGLSQDLIFTHWRTTENMPEEGEVVYGLDFGFNNPSSLVKVMFHDGIAYVKEILYESRLTTNDLVAKIKELGISEYDEIYCDAAEPKTIEELVRCGFNAKSANKDVTEGIRAVKGTPLFVHSDSVNLLKEFKSYRWKTDRNGHKLDMPVKFADHACFIGETLIRTSTGIKRIDKITKNDFVLTSDGFRKVNEVYDNGEQIVFKYLLSFELFEIILICTPNHLVKTNIGWVEISKLQLENIIYLNNFNEDNNVEKNSAIQTAKLKHLEVEGSWKERVYDLNVDDMHEYFANGVLVHNCDAMRYAIYSKLTIPSVTWGVI